MVAGVPVTFTPFETKNPGPGQVAYRWLFGDGESASRPQVNHTYRDPGNYTVTLIMDNGGPLVGAQTAGIAVASTAPRAPCGSPTASTKVRPSWSSFLPRWTLSTRTRPRSATSSTAATASASTPGRQRLRSPVQPKTARRGPCRAASSTPAADSRRPHEASRSATSHRWPWSTSARVRWAPANGRPSA